MFDHVTLTVSDLEETRRRYGASFAALGHEPRADAEFSEWGDVSIARAGNGRPVTRAAHVAVAAPTRTLVDSFWTAATCAGLSDDGAPGLRGKYHADYYGAFVRDRDGNSLEAVHQGKQPAVMIDHVFLGVADLHRSRSFYESVLRPLGHGIWRKGNEPDGDEWVAFGVCGASLWLVDRASTENLHIAFAAADNATVDEFHRRALAAGYRDNGAPGERAYHPGYYGAFVLDPDCNNVEAVCHNR
jgi:catechol 2,3-dioxygenase-like lactoylglutathione lyase family enzyme